MYLKILSVQGLEEEPEPEEFVPKEQKFVIFKLSSYGYIQARENPCFHGFNNLLDVEEDELNFRRGINALGAKESEILCYPNMIGDQDKDAVYEALDEFEEEG